MRLLVVHAHPVPESFNHALFETFVEAASARNEVEALDLYAMGFDPVMSAEERRGYHDAGSNELPVRAHLDAVRRAEGLVFIYPTWQAGLPAMLKGWLDRVLVPHATFGMPTPESPSVKPGMQQIRLLGGISTYGGSWLVTRWVGDPGRRTIMRNVRALCHRRCRTFWHALHRMDTVSAGERAAYLEEVRRRGAGIA